MCSHSVPSAASSSVPVSTCNGVGKITLSDCTTIVHHKATSATSSASGGRILLSFFIAAWFIKTIAG